MIIPVLIIGVVVALDQISKYLIMTNMQQSGESFHFIKYILNITYTTNPGASFGILIDQRWIFMILSTIALIVMAAAIVYLGQKKLKGNTLIRIALAIMFGGGFSNMIERVFRGEVVDFLEFDFVRFAIFNVADTFICIGSVLFCICIFTGKYSLFENENSGKSDEMNELTEETDESIYETDEEEQKETKKISSDGTEN